MISVNRKPPRRSAWRASTVYNMSDCRPKPTCKIDSSLSFYVLNPTSIAKKHAIEQLIAYVNSHVSNIVILCESHWQSRHSHAFFNIPSFLMFRRDRKGRKDSGICVYIKSHLDAELCDFRDSKFSNSDADFELSGFMFSTELSYVHTTATDCII